MSALIDWSVIDNIFDDCLYEDGEPTDGYIPVDGVFNKFGLHPDRLEGHREEVREALLNLPSEFMESGGGGMSFLRACLDKDGNQWTSEHIHIEQLMCLGIGLDIVRFCLPREVWGVLPGGLPYFVVKES